MNLPPFLNALEGRIRSRIAEKIIRGKVDIVVRVKETHASETIGADIEAARSYARAAQQIAAALGQPDTPVPLSLIIAQPGVLVTDKTYDVEKFWTLIAPPFTKALETLCTDRKREGSHLAEDIGAQLNTLDECARTFQQWQPHMEAHFKTQVSARFHELVGAHVDEQRILNEVAALLVRYTINEEIVRLQSHLAALRHEIEHSAAPGKKIDFICQEINREINTIGSKNQFADIDAVIVTAKDAVENIREQARNIE